MTSVLISIVKVSVQTDFQDRFHLDLSVTLNENHIEQLQRGTHF